MQIDDSTTYETITDEDIANMVCDEDDEDYSIGREEKRKINKKQKKIAKATSPNPPGTPANSSNVQGPFSALKAKAYTFAAAAGFRTIPSSEPVQNPFKAQGQPKNPNTEKSPKDNLGRQAKEGTTPSTQTQGLGTLVSNPAQAQKPPPVTPPDPKPPAPLHQAEQDKPPPLGRRIERTNEPPSQSYTVGIRFCVYDEDLKILNLLIDFSKKLGPCEVLDYTADPNSTLSLNTFIELLEREDTGPNWFEQFLDVRDKPFRGPGGVFDRRRRYAALYLITTQPYREIRDNFRNSFPRGVQELSSRKWYVTEYLDLGSIPKVIAIVQGKNPNYGYSKDYSGRSMGSLKGTPAEFHNISAIPHTDVTSTGERVKVWGLQVEESIAPVVEAAMRDVIKRLGSLNGIHPRFKTDKRNSAMYDRTLKNIAHLPATYTGVPIIGVSPEGAQILRQELQTNPPHPLPIDLEGTSLTDRIGKYMVTTPMSHFNETKQYISRLLTLHHAQCSSDKFETAPMLQEQRRAPTNDPEDEASQDIFGDLSVASRNSGATNMSNRARRQILMDTAPPIRAWQHNEHVTMPAILNAAQWPVLPALQARASSPSADSAASEISRLSEENSRLQTSLLEKTEELKSMQQNFSQQINELKESRQHEIQAAVEDALVGKIIEIKSMKENFDAHLQELKANQQAEIQAAVSKISEARQLDIIQGQGQAIELKESMNSVQVMREQFQTEAQQSKIRCEKLADQIHMQENSYTAHKDELKRLNDKHEQEMHRAQQQLKQQEETFQQHITNLTDEMTLLKQMFAQMMSSNATPVSRKQQPLKLLPEITKDNVQAPLLRVPKPKR